MNKAEVIIFLGLEYLEIYSERVRTCYMEVYKDDNLKICRGRAPKCLDGWCRFRHSPDAEAVASPCRLMFPKDNPDESKKE